MAKKRISVDLEPRTVQQVDAAVEELGINRSVYLEQAVAAKLGNIAEDKVLARERDRAYEERDNANVTVKDAHQQRDLFKAKMEEAVAELAVAEEKIRAYEKRGWLARLLGRTPKDEGLSLEVLLRFQSQLKALGFTAEQIDQILLPMKQEVQQATEPQG